MARTGAGLSGITLGNFTEIRYGNKSDAWPSLSILEDVQSVGELSDEATIVDVQAYGQKYLKKLVGSANASAIEVVCNYDPTATGQTTLFDAYNNSTEIEIALAMFDGDTGVGDDNAEGTYNKFGALVASASLSNSFDETRTITFSLVPTDGIGDFTAVPATA
jgi:hypothetical protein